jgi:small Trp-rich protein
MWLVWVGVAFIVLKLLDFSFMTEISWWWVVPPFAAALFWFEIVERRLGMDKKKAFDEIEKHKKLRIQRALEADKNRKRR